MVSGFKHDGYPATCGRNNSSCNRYIHSILTPLERAPRDILNAIFFPLLSRISPTLYATIFCCILRYLVFWRCALLRAPPHTLARWNFNLSHRYVCYNCTTTISIGILQYLAETVIPPRRVTCVILETIERVVLIHFDSHVLIRFDLNAGFPQLYLYVF